MGLKIVGVNLKDCSAKAFKLRRSLKFCPRNGSLIARDLAEFHSLNRQKIIFGKINVNVL